MKKDIDPAIPSQAPPSLQFTMKVASRCNLACTYCYVYEKGDESWRQRPGIMSETTFKASVDCIRKYCLDSNQKSIEVVFHGGEPCLVGVKRFEAFCEHLHEHLSGIGKLTITLQTNGILIDEKWAKMLVRKNVTVGISLDGPARINDMARIDKNRMGTHDKVVSGISELRKVGLPIHILCVIQLGEDPIEVHEHLISIGADSITYLMPDQTHDTIHSVQEVYGSTPCADFLNPILDHWISSNDLSLTVQPFKAMARAILGGSAKVDFFGNNPYRYVFIEADGSIEGLDVLRVCEPGLAVTGLNVFNNSFLDIFDKSSLHRAMIFDGLPLPKACVGCPESTTCGGGYVPHRWSKGHFDNRSAWCNDLLSTFVHLRSLLNISPNETLMRRSLLQEMREEAST